MNLSEFSTEISSRNLSPLWERTVKLVPGSACVPALWRYADTRPLLDQAATLISKKQADRRVLVMENPSLRGSSFITNALYAGIQIILPGEVAPTHRHTPSALRFVMEGEGAYTKVDGVTVQMHPGDFVVTPSWAWHDHGNLGNTPVVWMDGLDTPFASFFGAHFRENIEGEAPAVTPKGKNSSPLIYPYARTRDALVRRLREGLRDPARGAKLAYTHEGAYPFATMAAFMQMLPAQFRGTAYRSTEGAIFNVAEGECRVELSGKVHHLKAHDVFVVPPWETYRFEADHDCFVFSFSDRAAQEALGYFREEYVAKN